MVGICWDWYHFEIRAGFGLGDGANWVVIQPDG